MRQKAIFFQLIALVFGMTLGAECGCGYQNTSCCESRDWGIHVDYTYWKARVCDTDFAIPFDGTNAIGDVRKIDPDYEHGFRIGFDKTCGPWSYGADYTYYRSDARGELLSPTVGDIAGTRIVPAYSALVQGTIDTARADWSMDYDTVDLLVGYHALRCGCFDAKVFGGIKLAYIDQQMNTTYAFTTTGETPVTTTNIIRQKINMDAYGASLGLEPSYRFSRCLDLFGVFSYDALVGKFDRSYTYQQTISNGATTNPADLKDDCWTLVGVANLKVGLRSKWEKAFCGKGSVILSAGYEFQHWFDASGFLGHQNVDSQTGPNLITIDRCLKGMGFDGPFVRLEATF